MVLLLSVLVLEANFQTRIDLRSAEHFRDSRKAFYLVRSAVLAGQALLREDRRISPKYDGLDELWATPIVNYPIGDGMITAQIEDEKGKLNLNALIGENGMDSKGESKQKQLKRLLVLLEMPQGEVDRLVDAIVDWIDTDSTPRPQGAENAIYERLEPSYSARNQPFETLSELHRVHGMTDQIYQKMLPYVTIYGDEKTNINTASLLVLQSLADRIDETVARRIQNERPFQEGVALTRSLSRLTEGALCPESYCLDLTIQSDRFSITAEGQIGDTKKVAHAVFARTPRPKIIYFKVE